MMNKIKYLFLIICLIIIPCTYAWTDGEVNNSVTVDDIKVKETDNNYNTPRSELPDYGVHKKWKITSSNLNNVLQTKYVDPSLKIYDYADILTSEEEKELLQEIKAFIDLTGMDMVILTDSFDYFEDDENETYAVDFYDYNDFGINDPDYSGVILFRNNNPNDKYYNVYTFGKAQLYFHFDRCEDMLDHIYIYMTTSNYKNAFSTFISDFTTYYDRGEALPDYYVDDMGYIHKKYDLKSNIPMSIFGGIVVAIVVIVVMVNRNKMIKKATDASGYIDESTINYNVKEDLLVGSITTHHRINTDSGGGGGHGGGGFHSSGGSSGGGHGGGGGRHG